jgi:TonB family protein
MGAESVKILVCRRRAAHVLILLFLVAAAFTEDREWEEANSLLSKASELETFKPDERPRFHLNASFTFHHTDKGTLKGTYQRDYVAPEYWGDQLEVADLYKQERVRIEKQIWTRKSNDLTPLQADLFFRALFTTTFSMTRSDVVDRVHNRKLDGVESRCVEFHSVVGHKSTDGEICVDRAASTVSYWKYGDREIWYSQYGAVASRLRPSHIVVAEQGHTSVEADLKYTIANELKPESLSPLKDAEMSDVCSSTRSLSRKNSPEPFFPPGMSRAQFRNPVVVIRAEVDETGRVQKAAVIESAHPIFDSAALEAVKQWTFEPRLCDGQPVKTITRLDVRFRH